MPYDGDYWQVPSSIGFVWEGEHGIVWYPSRAYDPLLQGVEWWIDYYTPAHVLQTFPGPWGTELPFFWYYYRSQPRLPVESAGGG